MPLSAHNRRPRFLRLPRRMLAVFVMAMYLLGGTLHGLYDLDVANPTAASEVASALGKKGHSEQKGAAEHHCHGCFSVTVPQPPVLAQIAELTGSISDPRPQPISSIVPDPDSPPPKA